MEQTKWLRGWLVLFASTLLWGCVASTKEVRTLDDDIGQLKTQNWALKKEKDALREELANFQKETASTNSALQKEIHTLRNNVTPRLEALESQLSTVRKEKDFLKNQLEALQKETAATVSVLQKEDNALSSVLKTNVNPRLETLQSQLSTVQKEKASLKNDLTAFQKETTTAVSALQKENDGLRTSQALRLEALQAQMNTLQREKDSIKNELLAFQKETAMEISSLRKEETLLKTNLGTENKKMQADFLVRFENLRNDIRTLSAGIEEYKTYVNKSSEDVDRLRGDVALRNKSFDEKNRSLEEKNRITEERLKGTDDRVKGIEGKVEMIASRQVGQEKTAMLAAAGAKEKEKEPVIETKVVPAAGPGNIYNDAYQTFQKGDMEGSLRKFEAFLKQYPNTELSDNAQFWIGESYYQRRDFEKAILEYEKVIAKYPEGDKVPAAAFKQALAFLELGDKANARTLLRRVMERYPQSDVAEAAKKKFEEIK